jgi:hypothetical protein
VKVSPARISFARALKRMLEAADVCSQAFDALDESDRQLVHDQLGHGMLYSLGRYLPGATSAPELMN